MSSSMPDYSSVVSATGFLRPRASRSLDTFHEHLLTSKRILALLGAGLSAPSGIPTYRGAGGIWQTHDVTQLCTPGGFAADPGLVWEFELERRKKIERAEPNAAHWALGDFARKKEEEFLALTMNVDDLSERAGHVGGNICHLHGSVFGVKCSKCGFNVEGKEASGALKTLLEREEGTPLKREDVPSCLDQECCGLLRPGVVWFTESIPRPLLARIANWINDPTDPSQTIDTMLVIGTSALVYPATAYIEAARRKGARVAVVDIEKEDPSLLGLEEQDWYFQGDAVEVVPKMLRPATQG